MTDTPFQFDEVGDWSVVKLDIIEKYGAAYTKAFSGARGRGLKKYYIDGFSGAGIHLVKRTREQVEGSPARAMKILPSFDGFHFIDMDSDKTAYLETLCKDRKDVHIYTGDANRYLKEILPDIQYKKFNRALCLLDPYGLHLDWEIMEMAGHSQAIDMFLNFPIMDMNRNAVWHNPEIVPQDGIERMNRFWGDESWRHASYIESPQGNLFSAPDLVKQPNDTVVAAFSDRLKKIAGFEYVPQPLPMRNSNNAIVYYLVFASPKPVADKIIREIFDSYR